MECECLVEDKGVFLVPVEDRTADTLIALIKQYSRLGTIMTDCWKSYSTLQEEGYIHGSQPLGDWRQYPND